MNVRMSVFGVGIAIWGWMLLVTAAMWLATVLGPSWLSIHASSSDLRPYIIAIVALMLVIEAVVGGVIYFHLLDERLITGGLYALSRNPYYASLVVTFPLLFALLLRSWLILVAGPFAMYAVIRILIVKEEKALEANYGSEYLEYKSRVNPVFPTIQCSRRQREHPPRAQGRKGCAESTGRN